MDMEESSEAMTGMLMELEPKMVLVLKTEVTSLPKSRHSFRKIQIRFQIEKVKLLLI